MMGRGSGTLLHHQGEAGVSSPDLDPVCRDDHAATLVLNSLKDLSNSNPAWLLELASRIDGRGLNHDSLEHALR